MSKDFKVKNGLQVTTNITASGHISGSIVEGQTLTADVFLSSPSASITNLTNTNITSSGNISASGRVTTLQVGRDSTDQIDFSTDNVMIFRASDGNRMKLNSSALRSSTDLGIALGTTAQKWKELVVNHITASGNISGSTIEGQTLTADVFLSSPSASLTNITTTNITASGNISASGTSHIFGGDITTTDLTATQITASIISASTRIHASDIRDFNNGHLTIRPDAELNLGTVATDEINIGRTDSATCDLQVFANSSTPTLRIVNKSAIFAHPITASSNISGSTIEGQTLTADVFLSSPSASLTNITNTNITASGNYSGSSDSTITIGGKLQAGSKSFLIPRPEGGKLEYGVLEGQQNDVFYRGELKGDNVILLPQEWEWLVNENTITVQLTSIGKHQELFVKEIKDNKIFIDINGMFKTKENIHCYYIIHGTRKDVELIRNYQ